MIKINYGFSLLELLISLSILLIILLGLCNLLLMIPKISYHHYLLLHQEQQFANYWTLLYFDFKKAGYGLSNISSLASFKFIEIENNQENNIISFFWNKESISSRLIKKLPSIDSTIYINKVEKLKPNDLAILAENYFINGIAHWSLILIENIEEISPEILKITFKHLYSGPSNYFLPFHELAYFIRVEKISYVFSKKEKKIDKIINDIWIEPVAEEVENNEFAYCKNKELINLKCVQNIITSSTAAVQLNQKQQFNLPNVHN